jgi:hypothetical protein
MFRARLSVCIAVLAALPGCAATHSGVPHWAPSLLTPAQRTAARQFADGDLAARDAASREVWGLLPLNGLDKRDWSVRVDVLPYRMSRSEMFRLLGRPDKYKRFPDEPYYAEMYRLTGRDPATGYFEAFAVAKYLLDCPPGRRGAAECMYLNVTLWRGTVVEAIRMQGQF